MKNILFTILLFKSLFCISQSSDSNSINYNSLKYEITNRDTTIMKVTSSDSHLPKFLYFDTMIFVNIIFPNLPLKIDTLLLKEKINDIMISNKLYSSCFWRDKKSIGFQALSFRSEEMKKLEKISFICNAGVDFKSKIIKIHWGTLH